MENYFEVSREFLGQLLVHDTSKLKIFEMKRDAILRGLKLYERKLVEAIETGTEDTKRLVSECEGEKFRWIKLIFEKDEAIVQELRKEERNVNFEIRLSKKKQIGLKKFKSHWVQLSGEGLDSKI